jgi:hypothetical protein
MHRIASLLFIGMMIAVVPAAAQQPKPPINETVRSLLENEQVKVKEMRLRPGAKIAPAAYPNSFIYGLTDGSIVYTLPGKTPFEIAFRAGEAVWIPSQLAETANETDKEIRVLVVEIKAKPPVAAKSRTKAKAAAKPVKPKK